jgi:hypothetical protein
MAQQTDRKKDLVEYSLQKNVRLEVYWRDDKAGYGPAASVYAHDQEVLRLDCFGEAKQHGGKGHCHVNLKQTKARQWMYPPGTVKDHIEHAMSDLKQNLGYCLVTNPDEKIQQTKVDAEVLEPIVQQAEKKMMGFMKQLDLG